MEGDGEVLLLELKEDHLYEIVLTTKGGLYRYQLKDVIRVVGFEGETPLIKFAYRANLITNICGTHITNEEILSAARSMEKDFGLELVDYTLYPDTNPEDQHVVMFMEFADEIDDDTEAKMKDSLNDHIRKGNSSYNRSQTNKEMNKAELRLLKKNTFYDLRQEKIAAGASSNQLKDKRVIEDEKTLAYFNSHVL